MVSGLIAERTYDFQYEAMYRPAGLVAHLTGKVPGGLGCTPCGNYVVMPLGSTILLKNALRSQFFMEQHSGDISCLRLSSSGKMLVSGQESPGESKVGPLINHGWTQTSDRLIETMRGPV